MQAGPSKLEQARELLRAGKLAQARAVLVRLNARGADAALHDAMRELCTAEGNYKQATFYAERALACTPEDAGLQAALGGLLATTGEHERAIAVLEGALAKDPANAGAHFGLVAALFAAGRIADAEAASARGLLACPGDKGLALKRVAALLNLGRADEALGILGTLVRNQPDDVQLAETMCTVSNYCTANAATAERVAQIHANFGRLLDEQAAPAPFFARGARPEVRGRRARLGVLSPDLRTHSVAFFALPLFEHLDAERFEIVVFDTSASASAGSPDPMTARFAARAAAWHKCGVQSPMELARLIHAQRVDVLLELSGLTAGHRIHTLRFRPAPVQVTYCGYPGTTGCSFMDYRVVDSLTDPEDTAQASETLVRIDPCFLCFVPPADLPDVAVGARQTSPITFGCFNALTKMNDAVLQTWARVLEEPKDSRLLLKNREAASADVRASLLERCRRAGIDASRIEIAAPTAGIREHLACYSRVDIALDTFPYNGTTTTCEALLMGVPVVTLAGDRHAGRVGLSLLSAAGFPELVAGSIDEYVGIASQLAGDRSRLAQMRGTLGARLLASPLCDGRGLAKRFGGAIIQMMKP